MQSVSGTSEIHGQPTNYGLEKLASKHLAACLPLCGSGFGSKLLHRQMKGSNVGKPVVRNLVSNLLTVKGSLPQLVLQKYLMEVKLSPGGLGSRGLNFLS